MKQKTLKNRTLFLALGLALSIPAASNAQVVLTANDSLGNSSFNTAGNWNPAGAPSAGNTYSTVGYLLRSPTTVGNYTFAGNALTIGGGNGGGANPFSQTTANNDALIFKASAVNLTVFNLILDGGQIRDGNTDGNYTSLNGNIYVTANGGTFLAQDTNFVNSAISGQGAIYIGNNGNGSAQRLVVFTSPSSIYSGSIVLNSGVAAANSRLMFADNSIMNFTIGANGVNNNISGIGTLTLDGDFNFNLAAAANTVGDSWNIIDPSLTTTYDTTFSVNGFTHNGAVWDNIANGVDYEFNTANGLLSVNPSTVPEPSTLALCGLGLAGFCARMRRKK